MSEYVTRYLNSTAVYNGNFYTCKIGGVVSEHLSDTIPSLTITIRQVAGIDFVRFSQIQIDATIWIISNVIENVIVNNSDGTAQYVDYELILSGPEIILQRKMTSALSISQPIDGSDKTSLYEEIRRLQYKVDGKNYLFGISDNLKSLTEDVDCAEVTLERSNLYDVLNVLLSQINYKVSATIDVDNYITIDAVSLDAGESATLNGLSAFNVEKNGADYANALNLKIERGINTVDAHLTKAEFGLTLRNRDNYAITDDNCELVLQNDIYGIKHLYIIIPKLVFQVHYTNSDSEDEVQDFEIENVKFDLAEKHLLEKSAYDLKDPISSSWNLGDAIDPDNQNYYIYYEIGDNRIQGFGNTWNEFLGFDGSVFEAILEEMILELEETYYTDDMLSPYVGSSNVYSKFDNNSSTVYSGYHLISDFTSDYKNWSFDVEYQAQSKYKLQFGKTIQDGSEEIALFDKQNEAYVNIEKYGDSEQIKADRTGNPVKKIRGKVADTSDLMELGEKSGEYILVNRQYSIYPDYVSYYYEMYNKYTVNNLFNAIAQKKRITQISTDYFDREILVKYKIKFSTDSTENYVTPPTSRIIDALFGSFIDSDNNDDAISAIYLDCRNTLNAPIIYYGTNQGYGWMQFTKVVAGNSLALHCQCETNSYIGRTKENDATLSNGGTAQNKVKYVDGYGEVYKFCLRCKTKEELEEFESENWGNVNLFNKYPFWANQEAQLIDYETIYKSQNERLGITLQFECCVSEEITPYDMPHVADRILIETTNEIGAGMIVVGNGYGAPDIEIVDNGQIKITTTLSPNSDGNYYLLFDNETILSWQDSKVLYVYIQR